jgi:hypothetical protein
MGLFGTISSRKKNPLNYQILWTLPKEPLGLEEHKQTTSFLSYIHATETGDHLFLCTIVYLSTLMLSSVVVLYKTPNRERTLIHHSKVLVMRFIFCIFGIGATSLVIQEAMDWVRYLYLVGR